MPGRSSSYPRAASSPMMRRSPVLLLSSGVAAFALLSRGAIAGGAAAAPGAAAAVSSAPSFAAPAASVSASSVQSAKFAADKGMDANNATAWISGSPLDNNTPQWIARKFDQPVTVGAFRIGCEKKQQRRRCGG